jgi:hypothetical protein
MFVDRMAIDGAAVARDALVIECLPWIVDEGPFHITEITSENWSTQNRILGRRLAITFGQY